MSYIPTYDEVKLFIEAVRAVSNYDFSHYSIKSFTRRLEKVLIDYNLKNVKELIKRVIKDREFLEQVVKDITVNTTEFFRDPELWIDLKELLENHFGDFYHLIIWHPGCSSGQEVYSMLILLDLLGKFDNVQIYGTDINEDMLEIARKGEYREKDVLDYEENFKKVFSIFNSKPKIEDFFIYDKKNHKFIIKSKFRLKPKFFKHDLVVDPPFIDFQFHIIMCRNVLIYFDPILQNQIYDKFYDLLRDDGVLILGKHESIIGDMSMKFKREGQFYFKRKDFNRFSIQNF